MENINPFTTNPQNLLNELQENPEKVNYLDETFVISLIRYQIKQIQEIQHNAIRLHRLDFDQDIFYQEKQTVLKVLFRRYSDLKKWNLSTEIIENYYLYMFFFMKEVLKLAPPKIIEQFQILLDHQHTPTGDKEVITAILRIIQPQKTGLEIIPINTASLSEIFTELKNYFNPEDHNKLWQFINGKPIDSRICFNGSWIWLVNLYRRLLKNGFIRTDKKTLANMLTNNFVYQSPKMKKPKEPKLQTTYDFLSQYKFELVPPENRIYNTVF